MESNSFNDQKDGNPIDRAKMVEIITKLEKLVLEEEEARVRQQEASAACSVERDDWVQEEKKCCVYEMGRRI